MLLAVYMIEMGCQSQECARAEDHSTQLLLHLYHHHHHWCQVNTYSTLRKFKICKLLLLFIGFLVKKKQTIKFFFADLKIQQILYVCLF